MPIPRNKTHEFFIPQENMQTEEIQIPDMPGLSIQIPVMHLFLLRLLGTNREELTGPD